MEDFGLLRDAGRRVQVRVCGAAEGELVVYFHGSPSSRLDIDYLDERSQDRGVVLAGFDRPGFGGSDVHVFDFTSVAADACAVADRVGAETFSVAGASSGTGFALATAYHYPERVRSVAVSGARGWFEPGTGGWDQLSADDQRGVLLIGTDDEEAERLLSSGDSPYEAALALDDDALIAWWREKCSPADQRTLDTGFGPYLATTMRESLRSGGVGWSREDVVRMGRWPFDLGEVGCPVAVWLGEQEADAADRAAWFTSRLPNVTAHVVPDRGHFVTFDDWDLILDSLATS